VVNDNYVNIDFYLDPIIVDGALQGFVYEEGSENPVSNAEVSVYSDIFWIDTATDESGYYYIDLPNGFYTLECWKEGYYSTSINDIQINNDVVDLDVYLTPTTGTE